VIRSIFNFQQKDVVLYEGRCTISVDNINYEGTAQIKSVVLPKVKIVIEAEFNDHRVAPLIDKSISFSIGNHKIDAMIISSKLQLQPVLSKLKLVSSKNDINIILDAKNKVQSIIFHLFNFHDFMDYNKLIRIDNGGYRISETTLESSRYNITIQSLEETSDNIKVIQEKGISMLTQMGKIEKSDGTFISIQEYDELENMLVLFFSFTKGSWINPTCPIGIDDNDQRSWYIFNAPKSEWKSLSSWFEPTHNALTMSSMKKLFLLFSELWEHENWQETLREVIYWFINANDGSRGVDTGIILAQTALERLSFEYVVNEKKLISSDGFKKIRASDKFKLLFSSLGIPLEIPTELIPLTKEAKSHQWLDGPHALTEIRNSLIHPEHKKHAKFNIDIYIDAHKLSLWYLELSILAICGFDDVYSNRIKNSIVEDVPYKSMTI